MDVSMMTVKATFAGNYKDRRRVRQRVQALGSEYLAEISDFRYERELGGYVIVWRCPEETHKLLMKAAEYRRLGEFKEF